MTDSVVGVVDAGQLGIHAFGRGLAAVRGLNDKHPVNQVDRLIGKEKVDIDELQTVWTRWLLARQSDVFVNLDWTEFDRDNHSILALSLQPAPSNELRHLSGSSRRMLPTITPR